MANEPFIPQSDRPKVGVDPDKSVGDLTVRDLQTILGGHEVLKYRKDQEKFYIEKFFDKFYFEKSPKEHFSDKFTDFYAASPVDPASQGASLAEHLGGLHKKIDALADQIAELKKSK